MNQLLFRYCPQCCSPEFHRCGNRLRCDRCQFTYFTNPAPATAGIIACDDEILFTVRAKEPSKGKLGLPGGFVDPHESLEEGLCREVKEELGLTLREWHYLNSNPNIYPYAGVEYHTCDAFFYIRLASKPSLTLQPTEIAAARWQHRDHTNLHDIAFPSLRSAVATFWELS